MAESTDMAIVKAGPTDAGGILLCLAEAFAPFRGSYTAEGFMDTILTPDTLDLRLNSMTVFVAKAAAENAQTGTVVGTVACGMVDRQEGHLRGMAVREAWQGRGIAQQLLECAESELRSQGCTRITLDTTAPLKRAMRFYERNGYRPSGKVGDFFGMELYEYVKLVGS